MTPRTFFAACALAAGLLAVPAPAATAGGGDASPDRTLQRIQFEQLLAFQRALGNKVALRSPYAPLPLLQLPDAKAQFEKIGGKLAPTLPTNEQLLGEAIAKTFEQMLSPGGCCPCVGAASCSDSLFCTGVEVCVGNNCAYGPPACNDGNPCTNDSCTENTDSCSFTPVQASVGQLGLSRVAPSTVATLSWSSVAGAASYNIYRGANANLGGLACFQMGVTGTTQNDDGAVPAPAFFYLVTSVGCGESSLGDGNPNPRPPAPGCP